MSMRYETGSLVTLITSAADLSDGNSLTSSGFDNTPGGANNFLYADFELNLPQGLSATIATLRAVELYLPSSVDASNFADSVGNAGDNLVPGNAFVGSFLVRAEPTASNPQRLVLRSVPLPPANFRAYLRNRTGVALKHAISPNQFTLKMLPYRIQRVTT